MVNNDPDPSTFVPNMPLRHESATTIVTSEETSSSPATDVPVIDMNLSELTDSNCLAEPAWMNMLSQLINSQQAQHSTIQSLSRAVTNLNSAMTNPNKKHVRLKIALLTRLLKRKNLIELFVI